MTGRKWTEIEKKVMRRKERKREEDTAGTGAKKDERREPFKEWWKNKEGRI